MSEKRKINQQDLSTNVSQWTLWCRIPTELETMLDISDRDSASELDNKSDEPVMNLNVQDSNNRSENNSNTYKQFILECFHHR